MADYVLRLQIHEVDSELGEESGFKEYPYSLPPEPGRFKRSPEQHDEAIEIMLEEMRSFANSQSHNNESNGEAPRSWSIVGPDGNEVEVSE